MISAKRRTPGVATGGAPTPGDGPLRRFDGIETLAVHAGAAPDPVTGALDADLRPPPMPRTPITPPRCSICKPSAIFTAACPTPRWRCWRNASPPSKGAAARPARRRPCRPDDRSFPADGARRLFRRRQSSLWRLDHAIRPHLQNSIGIAVSSIPTMAAVKPRYRPDQSDFRRKPGQSRRRGDRYRSACRDRP